MAAKEPTTGARLRDAAGAFGIHAALLAAFVAPIAARLRDETISSASDRFLYLWSAWWVRDSLFEGRTPYFTEWLYAPDGAPLVFHTLALLPSVVAAALTPALGPVVAYNAVALAAMLLAGLGGYAFCRQLTGQREAAWLGGAAFMLSPFAADKLLVGWVNLLCVGLLGFFGAAFVRATEPAALNGPAPSRARFGAALAAAAVAFTSEHLSVFTAHLGAAIALWRLAQAPGAETLRRLLRASWPTALAVAPYVAIVASYAVRFDLGVPARPPDPELFPEPISYLLPLHAISWHAPWVSGLGFGDAVPRHDLACYLGAIVFPISVAGLIRARDDSAARFAAAVLFAYLVLSLGPRLVVDGEYARLFGHRIPLPMALLDDVPVLGAVTQSGRFMAIVYLALAAGVAFFAARPPAAWKRILGARLVPVLFALVAIDYGIAPTPAPLPPAPPIGARSGIVLGHANVVAEPLYFQMLDRRPLLAGPLSRPLPHALERYRKDPGLACWLFAPERPPCDWSRFPAAVEALDVTGAWLRVRDRERAEQLAKLGFRPVYRIGIYELWDLAPPR